MEQEKESIFREFENRFLRELLDWYKKSKIKKNNLHNKDSHKLYPHQVLVGGYREKTGIL